MTLAELAIKITCDSKEAEKGIEQTEQKASRLSTVVGKVSNGVKTAGKVIGTSVAAASAAIGKIATSAVKAYGEYEQQVGGVKKLFGDSWEQVVKDAHDAFRTAGVDANTYMQNVTSFSASLIKSCKGNTEEAAKLSNRAMMDMSDNANTFGTNMESIQNAYQGFAKGNYTMLDNLKLGYGGTAKEMKKLIKDASKMRDEQKKLGVTIDANSMSFDNIVKAISVMQEHLGIAGTTADEAGRTFQGSLGMMKSAWTNLKIAIVSPDGNIQQALADFVESAKTFGKNAIPAFSDAIKGIGSVIKELAPVIAAELPGIISDLVPALATAAVSLVEGLAKGIVENLPIIIQAAGQIVDAIIKVFKESDSPVLQFIGDSLEGIKEVVSFVIELFTDFPTAVQKLKDSDSPVLQFIAGALETVKSILDWIIANKGAVVIAIGAIIGAFTISKLVGIMSSLSPITIAIGAIATAAAVIITNWSSIEEFFVNLWNGIKDAVVEAWNNVKKWWTNISTTISGAWATIADWFRDTVWNPIANFFTSMWDTIKNLWTGTKEAISRAWTTIATWFDNTVWKPIKEFFDPVWEAISQIWSDVSGAISEAWGKVMGVLEPIIKPIRELFQGVANVVTTIWDTLSYIFGLGDKTIHVKTIYEEYGVNPQNKAYPSAFGSDGKQIGDIGIKRTQNMVHTKAKGDWYVPYDDYPALLHRGEAVLTASQARRYRDGESGFDIAALASAIVGAVREGMAGAQVNSYLDGDLVADSVNRKLGESLNARRFA